MSEKIKSNNPELPDSSKCKWELEEDTDAWIGTCKIYWVFNNGGPKDNDVNFCPKCGKSLEIVSNTDELEATK
jgi:hypothetical protein